MAATVDLQTEDEIELVLRPGEIARVSLRVAHDDLALRAAEEKPLAFRVIRDPLGNQLRITQPESDWSLRRSRVLVHQLPPDLLELGVIPHRIEARPAHGDE